MNRCSDSHAVAANITFSDAVTVYYNIEICISANMAAGIYFVVDKTISPHGLFSSCSQAFDHIIQSFSLDAMPSSHWVIGFQISMFTWNFKGLPIQVGFVGFQWGEIEENGCFPGWEWTLQSKTSPHKAENGFLFLHDSAKKGNKM